MRAIEELIADVRRRRFAAVLVENCLLTLVFFAGLILVFSLTDYFLMLPIDYLRLPYVLTALAGAVFLVRSVRARRKLTDENILITVQRAFPVLSDELISAWQLSAQPAEGVSQELSAALKEKVEAMLHPRMGPGSARILTGTNWRLFACWSGMAVLALLLSVSGLPVRRVLGSLAGGDWTSCFTVSPGDGLLPWGGTTEIVVQARSSLFGQPRLYVRGENGAWWEEELEKTAGSRYRHPVASLTLPLQYRVRWGEWRTRIFTLTPRAFPRLGELTVRYDFPAYTGLAGQEQKGTLSIAAIGGTRVTLAARADRPVAKAEICASWKGNVPVEIDGDRLSASFAVREPGNFRIITEGEDGSADPQPAQYSVEVTQDKPPYIELLSPREDLIVPENAEVPLLASVQDDFGLGKVALQYRINEGPQRTALVDTPGRNVSQKTVEYLWQLRGIVLKPGDRLRYYLEAWDNNNVSGPRSSVTPAQTIEITDYMREHERLEADLAGLKDRLLGILADQTLAKAKLGDVSASFSTAAYTSLLADQGKVKTGMPPALELLDGLLRRMENDPYTDFATHSDYRGLKSHLEYLRDVPMTRAMEALQERQWQQAGQRQNEIIAALEKLSLLSGDIWQYQRMRDLLSAGDELKKEAQDLAGRIDGNRKPGEIRQAMSRIQDLLGKIQRQMTKLPHELPEDFINSPALKRIDLQSYQDLSQQLAGAVERGDWEKAKELAGQLARELETLLENLKEAGDSVGYSSETGQKLQREITQYGEELRDIARQQEAAADAIERIDDTLRRRSFARQEDFLGELYEKQKELIRLIDDIRARYDCRVVPYIGVLHEKAGGLMKKVLDEFSHKRVYHSQKYLEDILGCCAEEGRFLPGCSLEEAVKKELEERIALVSTGEKEILDALKKPLRAPYTGDEKERSRTIAGQENTLGARTKKLRHSMENITRQSTALGPEGFENLDSAAREMESAAQKLSDDNSPEALEHGRRALEYLQNSSSALESAGQGVSRNGQKAGTPVTGPLRMRVSGAGGVRLEPVRLPRIDEYHPPREFRQEVLDALKEKYPQQYEKLIKDYFRRLTQ